jgi:hypothetical protein
VSRLLLGAICGIAFGAFVVATMIPLTFTDKTAAMLSAFLNRFAVGFVIGAARLPVPSWAQGLIFGVLLSLPDAIITKAYAPIMILGAIGGVVIGVVVGKWARDVERGDALTPARTPPTRRSKFIVRRPANRRS